ncbi:MAG: universal stress protein [Anaerolineae bacterium]|jgi:nucleotide-binding universal stress UspA family protein
MYNYILVPLDGSERAEAILPHVEELAKRYDAQVVLLQVVEAALLPSAAEEAARAIEQQELERHSEQAVSYLTTVQEGFCTKDIDARTAIYYGPVVQAIIRAAECECVDLIAIASHGRTGMSQVFYGSVAADVLQRIDRPLLLVRAQDA